MQRVVVQSADLSGAALDEFKQWLGISRVAEDAQLVALLTASVEMCEAFIRQSPLETQFEERIPMARDWVALSTCPVRAITGVWLVAPDGTRQVMDPADYDIALDADGGGKVRLSRAQDGNHLAVAFVAGIAADWSDLPEALRHGIVRLGTHHYRERDSSGKSEPPASVAALWRPWRQLRLK